MGFSENWLIWIRKAVTQGTLSVRVNDHTGPYFCSYKGVRQGDPFAPTMLNIAVNSLSKMVHMAQQNGLVLGLADHIVEGAVLSYNMQMIQYFSFKMMLKVQ
jgi:hypothetical protein